MVFAKVCKENAVGEGSGQLFEVNGKQVAIFKSNGNLFCIDAVCSHSGGPLQDGTVENNCVTCPWHGAQFDLKTGKVLTPPATDKINSYELKVENGIIIIDV